MLDGGNVILRRLRRVLTRAIVGAGLIAAVCLAASAATIVDPSFETPVVTGNYLYYPTGTGWSNAGAWGIAYPNVFYTSSPPDGSQAAFLQNASSSISQDLTLVLGDTYLFTFFAVRRDPSRYGNLDVFLGATNILSLSVDPYSDSWVQYTTNSIAATSSQMTLKFQMQSSQPVGDPVVALDWVQVQDTSQASPEPLSVGLLGFGIAALVGLRRRLPQPR